MQQKSPVSLGLTGKTCFLQWLIKGLRGCMQGLFIHQFPTKKGVSVPEGVQGSVCPRRCAGECLSQKVCRGESAPEGVHGIRECLSQKVCMGSVCPRRCAWDNAGYSEIILNVKNELQAKLQKYM